MADIASSAGSPDDSPITGQHANETCLTVLEKSILTLRNLPVEHLWALADGLRYHLCAPPSLDGAAALVAEFEQALSLESGHSARERIRGQSSIVRRLPSTWTRRVLVMACEEGFRRLGLAQHERSARSDGLRRSYLLDTESFNSPQGCASWSEWIASIQLDYLSWDSGGHPGPFWECPHSNLPITEGAELVVYRGQALFLGHGSSWTDLLKPSRHRATPESLAGFSELTEWEGGPFFARAVFVGTEPSQRMRWGIIDGLTLSTEEHHAMSVNAFGYISVSVCDFEEIARRFLRDPIPDGEEFERRLSRLVGSIFAEAVHEVGDGHAPASFLADLDDLRDRVAPYIRDGLQRRGLRVQSFEIITLRVPPEMGFTPTSARSETLMRAGSQVIQSGTSNPSNSDNTSWDTAALDKTLIEDP